MYRTPTHTDQYLDFNSAHPVEHKLGVVRTLHQRAEVDTSDKKDLKNEIVHLNKALKTCNYLEWAIKKVAKHMKDKKEKSRRNLTEKKDSNGSVVLPYIKNKADKMKRIFTKHKINVCFKPYCTLRQMLVCPKDKTDKREICGPVYKISCEGHDKQQCGKIYIGETERTLKARFSEHRRPSSSSSEVSRHIHQECSGHGLCENTGQRPFLVPKGGGLKRLLIHQGPQTRTEPGRGQVHLTAHLR